MREDSEYSCGKLNKLELSKYSSNFSFSVILGKQTFRDNVVNVNYLDTCFKELKEAKFEQK
jgi:hypothetical protein